MALSIGGLGSGLDTAGIVAQLMATERIPQAKVQAQGAAAQRQVSAWNELRTKVQSLLSAAEALRTPAKAVAPTATSSSPAVRVTAGETAAAGQSSFYVRRLATAEQRTWEGAGPASMTVGAGRSVFASGSLGTQTAGAALDTSGATAGVHTVTVSRASAAATAYGTAATSLSATDLTVTLADGSTRTATLASTYDTPELMAADLQAKLGSDVQASVVGGRLQVRTASEGAARSLAFSGGAATALGLPTTTVAGQDALVTVNGKRQEVAPPAAGTTGTVALGDSGLVMNLGSSIGLGTLKVNVVETDGDDTLTDLASKLSAAGSPLTASLITAPDGSTSLITTATSTGEAGRVEDLVTGHALFGQPSTRVAAQQALLQVGGSVDPVTGEMVAGSGGKEYAYSSNTVTDLVPGVTFELLYRPPVGPSGTYEPVTTSVTRDTSGTKDKVKALVDAMNGLLDDVKNKTKYDVATRNGGPLVGNGVARSLSYSVFSQSSVTTTSGDVRTLSQLGITTTRDGRFEFDAAVLTKALESSPDDVARVVAGVADKVAVWAKETSRTGGVLTTQRDGADAEVTNRRKQVDAMETRLARTEERYRRQFAALETAMAQLNSQRNAMGAALGSLGL